MIENSCDTKTYHSFELPFNSVIVINVDILIPNYQYLKT